MCAILFTSGRDAHRFRTMTLIQQVADNAFELTTEKGKLVNVTFTSWGRVNVLVGKSMGVGRMFGSLGEAAESYKSAEVKSALRALMEA